MGWGVVMVRLLELVVCTTHRNVSEPFLVSGSLERGMDKVFHLSAIPYTMMALALCKGALNFAVIQANPNFSLLPLDLESRAGRQLRGQIHP